MELVRYNIWLKLEKYFNFAAMKALINKLTLCKAHCLIGFLLMGLSTMVIASKGGEEKEKKGYVLKVNGFEVKKTYLSPFTLMQQGASFRGVTAPLQGPTCKPAQQSIMTFQKGNTIYIYPIAPKGFLQKFKTPQKQN